MIAAIEIPSTLASWMENPLVHNIISSGLVLLIGLPLAALAARVVYRVAAVRFSVQAGLMLSRAVRWILFAVVLATVLNQFGVKLGAALGAAGIVGIAVGFAAQTSLLLEALRIQVATSAEVQELIRRRERVNTLLKQGVSGLEDRVRLGKELRDIERELAERWYPAQNRAVREVVQGLNLQLETLGKMEPIFGRVRGNVDGVGDAGVNSARDFQSAWAAALGAVSTGVGGIAGQIASIGQAFLSGGLIGGFGAAAGMLMGQVFGGDRGREAHETQRMAEEAARAADALRQLAEATQDSLSVRGLRVRGLGDDAERVALEIAQREEIRRRFAEESDPVRAGVSLFDASAFAGMSLEEMQAEVAALRAMGDDFNRALADFVEMAWVQAREMEALEEEQARRRGRAIADFNSEVEALEATIAGDGLGVAIANINAQIRQQIQRYEELYRAGVITEEQFNRVREVLGIKLVQDIDEATAAFNEQAAATRDTAAAAREAAAAERERQAVDLMSLEVRLLRAQGLEREAQVMQAQIELQRAMNDGRSSEYLTMLQMTLALEAQQRATQQASRGANDLSRSLTRAASSMNVPQMNWNFLRSFSAERAGIIGSGGGGSRTTYNLGGITVVAAPGQDPRELWASIKTAIEQDAQDGDSSAFRSLEFN